MKRKKKEQNKKPANPTIQKKVLLAMTIQTIIMLVSLLLDVFKEWRE